MNRPEIREVWEQLVSIWPTPEPAPNEISEWSKTLWPLDGQLVQRAIKKLRDELVAGEAREMATEHRGVPRRLQTARPSAPTSSVGTTRMRERPGRDV